MTIFSLVPLSVKTTNDPPLSVVDGKRDNIVISANVTNVENLVVDNDASESL